MSTSPTPSIFDGGQLAAIKRQSRSNDPAALKAAAQQFEALFLQMVLKSMREATPKDGLFDNDQTRLYESLLDQQMGQVLARRGGGDGKGGLGLAALIESQLSRHAADGEAERFPDGLPLSAPGSPRPLDPARSPLMLPAPASPALPVSTVPLAPSTIAAPAVAPDSAKPVAVSSPAAAFVDRIWPDAVQASQATGLPARFIVAHAALESGWGRAEPRRADGRPSHNLFGIKAGRSWSGDVVEAVTTEYVDGVARQRVERFRAYASYAEAMRDYADLLTGNARYAGLIGVADGAAFAQGLQRAGYATDPAYADKLTRIIGGQTLSSALPA
jgi:flagellar protein FlgJ